MKISRLFNGTDIPQSEQVLSQNPEESSLLNRSLNKGRNDYRPSTTFGILQEISNSTRNRYSQKRLDIPIAEDNPERPLLDFSPPVATPGSWYHDAPSTQQSPLTFHSTNVEFDTMRLREISGNELRSPPPLSSPLARQVRGRKKRAIDLRKTTFGASEYIEHIENELQEVKEAMHSPSTGKPLQDKLKNLQAENKQLKESLFELEETFDERVKQAVEHKAAVEADMCWKIKTLEAELVLKENVISDLEHDREEANYDNNSIDALRAMIERLEQEKDCLEEANRVVEKRNEALTGLLAQSPTRSHHGFELVSPIRPDSRRTPRPKSMIIPKLSSPRTENYRRPQSVQASPAQSPVGFFSPSTVLKLEDHHHSRNNTGGMDVGKVSDPDSLDSRIRESCSARSLARGGSRRSSTASHASANLSAWGLPLLSSPSNDKAAVKQCKHRRTRRFESGSTHLKPLLLPTMAAEDNASYTIYTSTPFSSPTRREFSEQSLDPTVAFLSQPFGGPPQCPALPSKRVSETALKASEGSSPPHFKSFEEMLAQNDSKLAVLGSSPIQNEMLDQSQDLFLQESDSPSCVDDTIVEGDFTAFLASQLTRATNEQMFSSLNDQILPTAPDQDSPCSPEWDPAPSNLQLTFGLLPIHQQSAGIDLYSDHTPLRQMSAVSSQELMPEPLFLPSASFRTSGVPGLLSRSSSPIRTSYDVDDSPIPRKRQRSSDPDSCYFVIPKLCINPTHHTRGHEEHLPDIHVSPLKVSTDSSPELRSMEPPSRPRSPLERLHQVTASPAPLTSITIRTVFGTLSRYTSYVREIRRDPTALARRVIANAWHSNWKRLGKLSWWVLGLFLGPSARAERLGGAQESGWDWDQYDGGAIAGQVCREEIGAIQHEQVTSSQDPLRGPFNTRVVRFDKSDPGYRTDGTKAKAKPALKQGALPEKREKTSWGKSLYLWGKFSVAILLAVGGAVISGPGEMLRDCAERVPGNPTSATHDEIAAQKENREVRGEQETAARGADIPGVGTSEPATANESQVKETILSSEARNASGVSARSLSGTGAGPTLGVVKLGRSGLKTPSPARRRRQALGFDLPVGNAHPLGSAFGSDSWDRSDDNGGGKAVESRTINDEQRGNNIVHARPDHEHTDVGKLQWVQNLNIMDFQIGDDQEEPVRFHSASSKRARSMMN